MKNSTIFPFERNQYFYGKLLSVDDFALEQKYGNDKRRMINRFVCGTGVIAGMYVVMVDEQTVSVEAGCALDSLGREIVVDAPVIKKLSLIDGFESCADMQDSYVYLCIEYSQEGTNPVHNIAGNSGVTSSEGVQNNRIREGYRLYLTNQKPEEINLSCDALYEEKVRIYSGQGVTIIQNCPKFVQSGQEAELTVEVENLGQQYISFSYTLNLTGLTYQGDSQMTVSFDEMMFEKKGRYTLTYHLKAMNVSEMEGSADVESDSFGLYIAKQKVDARANGRSVMKLTARDGKEELLKQYHYHAMESLMEATYKETIYLGKIYMIKAGDSYFIDRIEQMPYNQYVMSNALSGALIKMLMKESVRMGGIGSGVDSQGQFIRGESALGAQVRDGVIEFDLGLGGQRGQRLISGEIFHGLGLGRVAIQTGLEEEQKEVVYGSSEVFEDQKIRVESAVRTYEDKGSFAVGIRLLETVMGGKIKVRWTAVKNVAEEHADKIEKKIFIKPGILELGLRESYYLEANCVNMTDKRVEWSVKNNGGFVDSNGHYTAPNTPGVYEVVAQSVAFSEVKASIFVVVRNKS
ncbi:MAG: hypothetical protein QM657_14540 [Lacrimispora sp.]|uniref:hypothetical protein n=1 Tax=Lacrimispora sp. TaxID=2719234 RepID=UPI0039E44B42